MRGDRATKRRDRQDAHSQKFTTVDKPSELLHCVDGSREGGDRARLCTWLGDARCCGLLSLSTAGRDVVRDGLWRG